MGTVRTIMVVDKEKTLQETIARYLADEDINILSAATNRDAVSLLEAVKDQDVDLVLVDRQIPGTTIRALYPVKPGEKTQEPKDTMLFKPFTKQQLKDFIHSI
jgi:DNA-binding NtrC family response regulator